MFRKIMIVAVMVTMVLVGRPLFAQDGQIQGMNAELDQIQNAGGTTLNRSSVDAAAAAKVVKSGNSQNDIFNVNSNDSGGGTAVGVNSITQNFPKADKPNMQAPGVYPPYMGMWNHGGWGILRAYFPNGPASDVTVYERQFDPSDLSGMRDLRGVISSMPHKGPLEVLGAIFNPDGYHYGRGVRLLGNSLVRNRRPEGKPLVVLNITGVEMGFLKENCYVYVGKVSMEGDADRNFDEAYDCMVQETLRWDVDIVLMNGGMKGITTGDASSNGGAGAAGQPNYSFSVLGAKTKGVTEPKGKAMVSGEGYRLNKALLAKRKIPEAHYSTLISLRTKAVEEANARATAEAKAKADAEAKAQARMEAVEARDQARKDDIAATLKAMSGSSVQNGNGNQKKEQQILQSKPPK